MLQQYAQVFENYWISEFIGHTRVLKLLLSRGALLHRDYQGRTPLHLAAEGGHVETVTAIMAV